MRKAEVRESRRAIPLEDKLVHNLYLTFKFSQGGADLQNDLTSAISAMYPPEAFAREFPTRQAIEDKLSGRIAKLKLPRIHTKEFSDDDPITPEAVSSEFRSIWGRQLDLIVANQIVVGDIHGAQLVELPERPHQLVGDILRYMAERDFIFVSEGRPGREGTKQDPFESFVKTYIIDQTPTTSDEFDQLFAQARELAFMDSPDAEIDIDNGPSIKDSLLDLQEKWEAKHPGEKFFDYPQAA